MTERDLAELLAQYQGGLDAEIAILRRLQGSAARQREATAGADLTALDAASDERDRLMAGLVNVEGQVRDVRQALAAVRDQARRLPGYALAVERHAEALALVSEILKTDAESVQSLAAAEHARRDLARAMEKGETTLAAYRRVTAATPGATLVDRRG
jgi:hypothetical protein